MVRPDRGPLLADALGTWAAGPGPLYAQLASALQQQLGRGLLPAGARLPSERALGAALGVSRTTVVAAYDQLRAAGWLRSHRGSGTRVARAVPASVPPTELGGVGGGFEPLEELPFVFEPPADDIELTMAALPGVAIVAAEAQRVAEEDLPALLRSFGYLAFGLPALRQAVAAHLSELGVPSVADEVLITSGAQQAIDLLARHLGGPGVSVMLENPTYPPAIDVFRASGAHLIPVPLDEEGIRTDLVRLWAQRSRAQLLFLNPICHNPTGTTLSESRRSEIARLATDFGLTVIDDMTNAYLMFDGRLPVPLAAACERERVITLGSLSKVAWGGLRIGWIRAPRSLVAQLAARKVEMDLSTSPFNQALAVRLLARFDELVPLAREAARVRLDALEEALRRQLPSWGWIRPAGGVCLWVRMPAGDAAAFSHLAADHAVIVRPGPLFSADGSCRDRLRLAYGHEPALLEEAVTRLADAWSAFRPASPRSPRGIAITV
ncbi:MAG: PLP-dependent aminotransferase family protein [Candidatus Limnocylindrales bacterium]|jgi:DNA-binding transcriptional MocR family regulator